MPNEDDSRTEVLRGTLDLLVLRTLVSLGPSHGYTIASRLEEVSEGALVLNMGTLYPGLMRLEHRGLIEAEWGLTDLNRRARFYSITPAGRRHLVAEKRSLDRFVSIIDTLFRQPAWAPKESG
ncbi:MAG: PadR family transcriptional regulator [Gammaproteobacteria bacterium]|nr:PadR family transcriptional regulator [Gammaproteobacteria bacterium]